MQYCLYVNYCPQCSVSGCPVPIFVLEKVVMICLDRIFVLVRYTLLINFFKEWSYMWGLWWSKCYWCRFSKNTSVSPANNHSTNFSILIFTRGWHNRPIGGRSAEWIQLDSTPHYTN
jgi:hypothetical protein